MVSKSQLIDMFSSEIGGHVDEVFVREFTHWLNKTYQPRYFKKKWLVSKAKEFFEANF